MLESVKEARDNITNFETARQWYANGQYQEAQVGKVGVDVAVCANNLRTPGAADRRRPTSTSTAATAWRSAACGSTTASPPT